MFRFWRHLANSTRRPGPAPRAQLHCERMEERAIPSAGALDPTFGAGGRVVLSDNVDPALGGMIDRTARVMPDGSMYVVGSVVSLDTGVALGIERYNSNGNLDLSFGTNGRTVVAFDSGVSRGHAAAVQADGKIVIVGSVNHVHDRVPSGKQDFAITRLNADGSVDTSFAAHGRLMTDFGRGGVDDVAQDVQILADGHILVAGTSGTDAFVLSRYDSKGALDTSYGSQGRAVYTANGIVFDAKIRSGDVGSTLLVGRTHGVDTGDTWLVKFNVDGSIASTFGSSGVVHIGGWNAGIGTQADGRILVASSTGQAIAGWTGPTDFVLSRYTTNGVLDTTFGDHGVVIAHFTEGNSQADAVAVQANGMILVGGSVDNSVNAVPLDPLAPVSQPTGSDFALVRLHANGSVDTTFGNHGKIITDFGTRDDLMRHLTVLADGHIVADGTSTMSGSADALAAARFDGQGGGDGHRHLIAVGAGEGGGPHVRAYDAKSGQLVFDAFVFDQNFGGGVRVATGDVNGDGVDDIVAAAGPGGASEIRVFSGADGHLLMDFLAYDTPFTGGSFVATADFNHDGHADIITGAGEGGGPHVKVFDGATGEVMASFMAYDTTFAGGVRVAAGDVNGDGFADIVAAAGPGGAPQVEVFDGTTGAVIQNFLAYSANFSGGVYVAAGDVNGDGHADVITGAGQSGGPQVKILSGSNGALLQTYYAFGSAFLGGVRVAAMDRDGDGLADAIVSSGPGAVPKVRTFAATTGSVVNDFNPFEAVFTGGAFIG